MTASPACPCCCLPASAGRRICGHLRGSLVACCLVAGSLDHAATVGDFPGSFPCWSQLQWLQRYLWSYFRSLILSWSRCPAQCCPDHSSSMIGSCCRYRTASLGQISRWLAQPHRLQLSFLQFTSPVLEIRVHLRPLIDVLDGVEHHLRLRLPRFSPGNHLTSALLFLTPSQPSPCPLHSPGHLTLSDEDRSSQVLAPVIDAVPCIIFM